MQAFQYLLATEKMQDKDSGQNKNLKLAYKSMKNSMRQIEQLQSNIQGKKEQSFIQSFRIIIEKMSRQVLTIKNRYLKVDKQLLKNQKCEMLNKEVTFYQHQASKMQTQLKSLNQQLQAIKTQNDLIQNDIVCLNQSLRMKKRSSSLIKKFFLTQMKKQQTQKQPNTCRNTYIQSQLHKQKRRQFSCKQQDLFTDKPSQKSINIKNSPMIRTRSYIKSSDKKNRNTLFKNFEFQL